MQLTFICKAAIKFLISLPQALVGQSVIEAHDLVETFDLDVDLLQKFLTHLQNGYRNVPYHCALHGADVTQTVHFFLQKGGLGKHVPDHFRLAALVAAMVHDVGHPARTNSYLYNSEHELAITYFYKSPLERMHCALGLAAIKKNK